MNTTEQDTWQLKYHCTKCHWLHSQLRILHSIAFWFVISIFFINMSLQWLSNYQGSHSLGYKNFKNLSKTPEAFFQDLVIHQGCLKIDKQQLLWGLGRSPGRQQKFSYIQIKSELILASTPASLCPPPTS